MKTFKRWALLPLLSVMPLAGADVTFSPSSLTFGGTNIGASATAQSLLLANTGAADVSISSLVITGVNSGDFSETNTCGPSLAAGGTCSISVTFTPTSTGARLAAITVVDNDGGTAGSQQSASLVGTGNGNAALSPSPAALNFGNINVAATAASQSILVTNSGSGTLIISNVTVVGAAAADFAVTNNCGTTLAAGATCTLAVNFTPAASGARSATLTFADNAADTPQSVSLLGMGVGVPTALFSPPALAFGSSNVAAMSPAQSTTLSNSGSGALLISSISLGGANAGDFTVSNNCGGSVAVQASCSISASFSPTTAGARSATISFTDNAGGNPQTVTLSGTGIGVPNAVIAPMALNLGSINIGATAMAQSVTLTNTGSATLNIADIAFIGANTSDFGTSNNCGGSVPAQSSCKINLTFNPLAAGIRSASLVVIDNSNNIIASQQSIALSGMGLAVPKVAISPSILNLGNANTGVAAPVQTVVVSNSGSGALAISAIALSGPNATDFSSTDNCNGVVAVAGSCTILVTFTPGGVGTRFASLLITDNTGNAAAVQQSVPLTGTGVALALVSVTPASLGFAARTPPQIVTVTNNGTGALTFASISIGGTNAGNFSIVSNNCGSSLNAGSSCNINVGFAAVSTNSSSATLNIVDNANNTNGSSQSVNLTGQSALAIQTVNLPGGTTGTPYPVGTAVVALGGTSPYLFSLTGSLPSGLTLSNSGVISGTPATAGASTFTVTVTDSGSPAQTVSQQYTLTIAAPALSIQTQTLSNGMIGTAYASSALAQGGTTPYTWSVTAGALPPGTTLSAASGIISGTASQAGTFPFTLQVTDHSSPVQTASHAFVVVIAPGVLSLITTSLPNAILGNQYSQALAAQGGTPPYRWSTAAGSGLLPGGLTLNAASGILSGTPSRIGNYTFMLQVSDSSSPAEIAVQQFTVAVSSPPAGPVTASTITFTGLSGSVTPGDEITTATLQVNPAGTYPVDLSVALSPDPTVTGLPDGYLGDAGFVGAGNVKSAAAPTITTAATGAAAVPAFDPGTVAGTLTITPATSGQTFAPTTLVIEPAAPLIEANSVQITSVTSTGFDVEVVATSTTRDLKTATFTFSPAPGAQLNGNASFSVDVSSLFVPWFASTPGLAYGGAFSLTMPFTFSGSSTAIQSVSVTLTNAMGTSLAVAGSQ